MGHCQKCGKFNIIDKAASLAHPCIAIKYKKALLSNLGSTVLSQMTSLMIASITMLGISLVLAVSMGLRSGAYRLYCDRVNPDEPDMCKARTKDYLKAKFGTFGGIGGSASLGRLAPDSMKSEIQAFAISNGAQLLYAMLYLLLIYKITLIVMEHEWGKFGERRQRLRCTLVRGSNFDQSYLLQLPKSIIYPAMAFSSTMHWLLGQAISTQEIIYQDPTFHWEHSVYSVGIPMAALALGDSLNMEMLGYICHLLCMAINHTDDIYDGNLLVGFYIPARRVYPPDVWVYTSLLCCDQ